jgi:microcystin-dependent protein
MALYKYNSTTNKLVPLTSEGNVGLPVGAVLSFPAGTTQSGWLLCDGSTFDRTVYPALYTYLGSNVLPDYRECVLVGVGQNDTDTIAEHDVYALGEFKDDQLQDHTHALNNKYTNDGAGTMGGPIGNGANNRPLQVIYTKEATGRTGTTTHGKQKGVAFYIKATSSGPEVEPDIYATKGYIRDQNVLSDYESISWTNSAAGAFEMQYDGVFCSGNGSAEGVNFMISSDGGTSWTRVLGCGGGGLPGTYLGAGAQILLQKGWKVYAVLNTSSAEGGLPTKGSVAYYKLRDYTGR